MRTLLAFALLLTSLPAWGATYTATACTSSAFATAIASAGDGDTMQGPSGGGTATWTSTVTVSKGIRLDLRGCLIAFSGSGGLVINTDSTSFTLTNSSNPTTTGFSGCYPDGAAPVVINMASGPPYNAPWRIYNITFTDGSSGGTCYIFVGLGPGLYDHNTISTATGAAETIHLVGGNANCTSCWTEDVVPGSGNMVIMENDVWTETNTSQYCQIEEGNYGAVFTIRDSQFNYCQGDVHGGPPSNRWLELYDNTYNHCCTSSSNFDFRGGSGVIWGNVANNNNGNVSLGPISGSSDVVGPFQVQYQFGTGIGGNNYSPFYMWGGGAVQTSPYPNYPSMVQIGTSPSGSPCSGLSGTLCNAVVTTTQPATLERCETAADVTAGCPVSYTYAPYTYPHPEDNCLSTQVGAGATCSGVTPTPPTGLTGIVAISGGIFIQ
ncbi:MAG: hypothetical protein WA213_21055 [Terriglobales bacterium]